MTTNIDTRDMEPADAGAKCHYCHGKGWADEGDPEIGSAPMDCHVCKGRGRITADTLDKVIADLHEISCNVRTCVGFLPNTGQRNIARDCDRLLEISATLAALRQPIGEGWVAVPVDLTEAMIDAWFRTPSASEPNPFAPRYRAMIAAAPKPNDAQ